MIRRLRPLKVRKLLKVLRKLGFRKIRQTASHIILKQNKTERVVIVPIHGDEEIGRGLLRKIILQIGLSIDEFLQVVEEDCQ
ncbi:MAG: hypothetical protein DRJ31_04730 [Candidatus Methanomethylicota archaeon]|uniref:Type II toxin-antitoxin system HicA family toxin n=1 Tax=Thermoproteota archaeon TaxID=2056631 RepID=A0A497ERZ3_9CREN|nr:MAG: hypothetical protein DRJ31_04730 [Candidatus Verstraetearchaeota archaeon]